HRFNIIFAVVKLSCFILVFILTALSGYPCSDSTSCADEKKAGVSFTVSSHEHSSNEVDLCSPFCHCSCCSTQIHPPSYFFYKAYSKNISDLNSIVKNSSIQTIHFSIWQPPKLT